MANLEDVPSLELMTELLRRMKCSSKPDKRLILIGTFSLRNRSDPSLYLVYREMIDLRWCSRIYLFCKSFFSLELSVE